MQSEEKHYLNEAIIEQFRRLMGGCPRAQQRTFQRDSAMDTEHTSSAMSGEGMPSHHYIRKAL